MSCSRKSSGTYRVKGSGLSKLAVSGCAHAKIRFAFLLGIDGTRKESFKNGQQEILQGYRR